MPKSLYQFKIGTGFLMNESSHTYDLHITSKERWLLMGYTLNLLTMFCSS